MENNFGTSPQPNESDGHGAKHKDETTTFVSELSMGSPLSKFDNNWIQNLLEERRRIKRSLDLEESNAPVYGNYATCTRPFKKPKLQSPLVKQRAKSQFGFCRCPGRSLFDEFEVVQVVSSNSDSSSSVSRMKERNEINLFISRTTSDSDISASTSSGYQSSNDFSIQCEQIPNVTSSLSSSSSDESQQPSDDDESESCRTSTPPPLFQSILHDVKSKFTSRSCQVQKKVTSRKRQVQKKVPSSVSNASAATKRAVHTFRGRLAECIMPPIDSPTTSTCRVETSSTSRDDTPRSSNVKKVKKLL